MRETRVSKLKLLGAMSVVFLASFVAQFSAADALGTTEQKSLYIYSPYTNKGTTVYYGTSTASVIPATTVSSTTATSTCVSFISSFNKQGSKSSEVTKLQMFLNEYTGSNLNNLGYFGPATEMAVKNLQNTYGVKVTGAQYEKTTALINSLKCGKIAKKAIVKYTAPVKVATKVSVPAVVPTAVKTNAVKAINMGSGNVEKVVKNIVKEYPAKEVKVNTDIKGKPTLEGKIPAKATVSATSTNSFFSNLQRDWEKVKENYKAYALVFLLVLALFWFLRKAATE